MDDTNERMMDDTNDDATKPSPTSNNSVARVALIFAFVDN